MNKHLMASSDVAKLIVKSFPHNDLLNIDPAVDARSLSSLAEASKESGDSLFRWVVNEAYEGATEGDETDTKKFEQLLTRGIEDIRSIIRNLPDASGFYR